MDGKIVTDEDYNWLKEQFIVDRFLRFEIDKHEVFIGLTSNKKRMLLSYIVIVDGKIQTSEEQWVHIKETSKFSKKYIKKFEEMYGKKVCKERGMYEKISYTLPCFPSFSALKKMLKRHNEITYLEKDVWLGFR